MSDTTRSVKIYINGREVENTLKGVSQAMTKTRNELSKLTFGTEEYNKKCEQLKGIKKHYDEITKSIKGSRSALLSFFDMVKANIVGELVSEVLMEGLKSLANFIPNLTSKNAKLSDSLVDVMQTTDMTAEEVANLQSQFKGLNTRTATNELNEMAAVAGQLGVNKGQIGDFVNQQVFKIQ